MAGDFLPPQRPASCSDAEEPREEEGGGAVGVSCSCSNGCNGAQRPLGLAAGAGAAADELTIDKADSLSDCACSGACRSEMD